MTCTNCPVVQFSFYNGGLEKLITTTNIISARWQRVVNDVGKCIVEIPAKYVELDFDFLSQPDMGMTIEISERQGQAIGIEGNTYWFLVKIREYSDKYDNYFRLEFEDALSLIDRRLVSDRFDNRRDGSSRTLLLGQAADEMVRTMNNYMGIYAPDDLSLYPRLDTAGPSFVSPQIEKNVSFRRLLGVLQQLANTSKTNGIPLYFDLVPVVYRTRVNFVFRVFRDQLGEDKTFEVISTDHPHFLLDYFEIDYDQPNVGYVSGGGRASDRQVATAIAPEATATLFARREAFKFSTAYSGTVLQTEADNLIADASGTHKIKGAFVGDLYNRFSFGDRLKLNHRNIILDVIVSAMSGKIEEQELTRELTLTSV